MDLIQAIVLGIVQGLTEFLPISSTGHVLLVPVVFGWEDPGSGFSAVIQLGTMGAVLAYFRSDLARIAKAWFRGFRLRPQDRAKEWTLGWAIIIGTMPVVVAGLLLEDWIDNGSRSIVLVAAMLIGVGLLMALAERLGRGARRIENMSVQDGVVIGFWQCLALVPGASRSGSTIAGGMLAGLDRASAARFSFLLSVPAVLGSGVYKMATEGESLVSEGIFTTIVAILVSFVTGYSAVAFLMGYLQRRTLALFVWYRLALGGTILGLLAGGVIAQP